MDPAQLVKWRCKAVARPRAQYVWYKNGEVLSSEAGVLEVTGNILVIFSVDQDRDEGMYQCSATNVHGTTYSAGRLKVMCKFIQHFTIALDWLQSLKHFFINVPYHLLEASLTLMALFKTEPSELD